jgi:small subunit ribosomal protein S20
VPEQDLVRLYRVCGAWGVRQHSVPGYLDDCAVATARLTTGLPALILRALRHYSVEIAYMPNTKSAERRMRNSARKHLQNRSVKSRLHTLEKDYLELLGSGKKDDAAKALREISSAFDKAAKGGIVHRATADRKKSRLALRLAKAK